MNHLKDKEGSRTDCIDFTIGEREILGFTPKIPKLLPRIPVSHLNRASNCVNVATKCVNTLFLAQELGML
jgi:hypothetical protein